MNGWEFMDKHPVVTIILTLIVGYYAFNGWRMFVRHLSIRKVGWPPPYVDADGDTQTKEDES